MADDVQPGNHFRSEIATGLRRLAYATLALVLCVVGLAVAGAWLRDRDLEQLTQRNAVLIHNLDATADVLCKRGFTLIDLIDGALILVGQRLADDVAQGNAAAVRADQRFLTEFLRDREALTRELTGRGPCAPP